LVLEDLHWPVSVASDYLGVPLKLCLAIGWFSILE
jgi:hypothetical protein